jgi:hypothetical protein
MLEIRHGIPAVNPAKAGSPFLTSGKIEYFETGSE